MFVAAERADGGAGVALVQVEAGLVPLAHVHEEAYAVFGNLHELRRLVAGERASRWGEAFVGAHVDVGAFPDALRPRRVLHQRLDDGFFQGVGAGGRELHGDPAGVAVGHEAGDAVGFGVDEPYGVGRAVGEEFGAAAYGGGDAGGDLLRAGARAGAERKHPGGYLRGRGEESVAEAVAGGVQHGYDVACGGVAGDGGDGAGEYPRVAADGGGFAFRLESESLFVHGGLILPHCRPERQRRRRGKLEIAGEVWYNHGNSRRGRRRSTEWKTGNV